LTDDFATIYASVKESLNFSCLWVFALNADVVKGGDHFGPLRKKDGFEPRNLGTDDLCHCYNTFYGCIYEFVTLNLLVYFFSLYL
jgi:hypothetical protein